MKHCSLLALLLLLMVLPAAASPVPIPAATPPQKAIGLYAGFLREAHGPLSLKQAVAAYHSGKFSPSRSRVLNFGIGSEPVWIHFSVDNATAKPLPRELSIETAWLDRVDVYFRADGRTTAQWQAGDLRVFSDRPVDQRYFAFEHPFPPGLSQVYVRVQTPDPMVLPMYLLSPERARIRARDQDYAYGFLYGFLIALMAYNAMLYAGLRDARYLLYALYLGVFVLTNASYTGHGFRWLWPTHTLWEQWSNPVLMVLYGISGLFFALRFLDLRAHFPRVHKAVLAYIGAASLALLLTVAFGSQRNALLVAFSFVSVFTVVMLGLGAISLRSGQKPARYFLLAAISAMVGAAVTALSVWGFLPFNTWTFHAVDLGVMLDATLLALALTYQFRVGQEEKLHAEALAKLDPLTGLDNRRAFYDKAAPVWNIALRHDHALSVILLDIDGFKRINDTYGHACGDEVLTLTAAALRRSVRGEDLVTRWGGEEFLLLLPETELEAAAALAERLRRAIVGIRLSQDGEEIRVTASFGVAQRETQHRDLDALISRADTYLYHSKDAGRNRVSHP